MDAKPKPDLSHLTPSQRWQLRNIYRTALHCLLCGGTDLKMTGSRPGINSLRVRNWRCETCGHTFREHLEAKIHRLDFDHLRDSENEDHET